MGVFDFIKKKQNESAVSLKTKIITDSKEEVTTQIEEEGIPTLDSRIKSAYTSNNGLYPHEILMLHYAKTYKSQGNSFQSFWKWNYSVLDPQQVLDTLYKRGFVCYADASIALKNFTVSNLKEILEKKGEKASGKKDDLVKRVIETYSKDELESILPEKYYQEELQVW